MRKRIGESAQSERFDPNNAEGKENDINKRRTVNEGKGTNEIHEAASTKYSAIEKRRGGSILDARRERRLYGKERHIGLIFF